MSDPMYRVDVHAIVRDGNGWTDYAVWCQRRPELEMGAGYPPCVDWTVTVTGGGYSQHEIGFLASDGSTLVAHRSTYRDYVLNGPTYVARQWGIDSSIPMVGVLSEAGGLLFELWAPPVVEVRVGTAQEINQAKGVGG